MKVLLFTLTGLVIGVGIGMLFAPFTGNETRNRLLDSVLGNLGLYGEDEFSDSEMEMDATSGRSYGF